MLNQPTNRSASLSEINNTLEIVVNLIYLAKASVEDSAKVIEYLKQAERLALQLGKELQLES
ncbi:hypothetical protein [Granulicella sibirica]|uniref:Uncharacterized protein n=1 Tax=Granulicella sibirica TaxID=2479048 RepID=A0A4Q0T814_9BACT|nr:hypothetical protein [Granulicella sibirica]RXH58169.1 hypothetical protein GRAN_1479 [Granulicella sibirica]